MTTFYARILDRGFGGHQLILQHPYGFCFPLRVGIMRRERFNKKSIEVMYNRLYLGYDGSLEEYYHT